MNWWQHSWWPLFAGIAVLGLGLMWLGRPKRNHFAGLPNPKPDSAVGGYCRSSIEINKRILNTGETE